MSTKNQKFMQKLLALNGAVTEVRNVHDYVIRSPSPSLNFCFGNGHGLPAGFTLQLYGPAKGGKSLIANAMAGQLHRDDPDAFVVKFNTEYRELGQLTEAQSKCWGVDRDRYVAYETNRPDEIFDRIEKEFAALADDGMKLKLVIIDSLTQIQGRRGLNADTIMTQNIGDNALTNQEGLKRILPVQRKLGFGLILTAHIRAEMDQLEIQRHNKYRAATSFAVQHYGEYNLWVEANRNKAGREDLLGNSYISDEVEDLAGRGEQTAHKIRVHMKDSSLGPKGRSGEFTLDYRKGIVNIQEEVFQLGVGWNVIQKPNNVTYRYDGKDYRGKSAILEALRIDPALQEKVLTELRAKDHNGQLGPVGAEAESIDEEIGNGPSES